MNGNGLSQINDGAFVGQSSLETLRLSNNDLTEIQSGLFTDLTGLRVL